MRVLRTLSLAFLVPAALAAQSPESIENAAASITSEDIIHRIGIIAHDSMMGRETPSPGLDMTAEYIAREFQRLGLKPGGDDGTFLQRYPLEVMKHDLENSTIVVEGGPVWRMGHDVFEYYGFPTAEPVTGPTRVVWGTMAQPTDLASLDLGGAVVLVVLPEGEWRTDEKQGMLVMSLAGQGTAAIILISQRSDDDWSSELAGLSRPWPRTPGSAGPPLLLHEIRYGAVESLLAQHGFDLTAATATIGEPLQSIDLPELTFSISLQDLHVEDTTAPNTIGILEGSDPELKNEYLVFTGHMDHVGTTDMDPTRCGAQGDDTICNGADDNASGTISVVELAEAFSKLHPRPKRSMIFVTVSGEERGLWGSSYFTENPPVPIEEMVANINADMVGRNWTDTIVVIGKERSDLGETMHRVNAEHPELNMTAIDDIWPEENFFRRSDHFNFARRGVPILFFFNGTHDDYHQPSDEVEKIDGDKTARIAQLMFYLGVEVANAAEKPKWKEGMIP
jgi:hypothetical protein